MRVSLLLPAAALLLTACGVDNWFGERKPPLPGERLSVLAHSRKLDVPQRATRQILLPRPEPNADWPQAGGLAHHAMQHLVVGTAPQEVWSTGIGSGSSKRDRLLAEPIVGGNRVFTLDSEAVLTAFDNGSGNEVWSVDLTDDLDDSGTVLGGGLAYADGVVIATTGLALVMAFDAATGKEVWRTRVTAPVRSAPSVDGGRVFVLSVDNEVHALALKNGFKLWGHPGVVETASVLGSATPAVDEGLVVAPLSTGELVALRVENGAQLWSDSVASVRRTQAAANLADIRAHPVIDRGRVFVVGHSGLMVAVDLRTGRRLWEQEIASINMPWVAGDTIYVVTTEAEVAALDANNGQIIWVTPLIRWEDPLDRLGPVIWGPPILAGDRLLVAGSTGQLLSLSPYDGRILGRLDLPDGTILGPAVANGTIYYLTEDADLVALR